MAQTKQAKTINQNMVAGMMNYLQSTRHPVRNTLIFRFSERAGLRAKEIASINWSMITDAEGNLTGEIVLPDSASKGANGGRIIPIAKELRLAIEAHMEHSNNTEAHHRIIQTERAHKTSAQVIVNLFQKWFSDMGYAGCSSHSGRRTFITNASKKITSVGGSLRDIQYLAGHSSLQTTQRYIDGDSAARRKIVDLI
jgi:integrase